MEILESLKDPLIYSVKTNETKESIAKKFGVSIQNINTLGSDDLLCGDKIIIDLKVKQYHIVKPAERLEDISNKYNMSIERLKEINSITQIFVGQRLLISC
ncbi:MAG: LysM peptidoglycan-binding domain-containing protein [Christensenellaceae bacterium]|nr:LysM peptidoglycan-binding domain-containing protein [Christensenellaceae bacterium]